MGKDKENINYTIVYQQGKDKDKDKKEDKNTIDYKIVYQQLKDEEEKRHRDEVTKILKDSSTDEYYNTYIKYINKNNKFNENEKGKIIKNLNKFLTDDYDKNKIIISDEIDNFVQSFTTTIMERKIFSTNLKKIMDAKDLNVSDLANLVKVPYSTANDWVNAVSIPRYSRLELLAEKLGVSRRYLLEPHNENKPVSPLSIRAGRVPVLGRIPAGIPIEAIEDIIDYEEIPYKWFSGQKDFFALEIKGDSMAPNYAEGDRVIFQKAEDCENGQHCAVMVNGNDATFKKVLKSEVGITLVPLNEDYEPIFYSNKQIRELPVRIIGIAKEIRRKLF